MHCNSCVVAYSLHTKGFDRAPFWSSYLHLPLLTPSRGVAVDLADVMDQAEEQPLSVHFTFTAQRETIEPEHPGDMGKDRFHGPKPPAVNDAPQG